MADVEVRGADDFHRLSKALKEAGRTTTRRALHKGLTNATKPLIPKAQQRLAANLPGPLQVKGRRTKHRVAVSTGRDPAVRVAIGYGKAGAGLHGANAQLANKSGEIKAPLFGNRDRWFRRPVPGARGWFDDTFAEGAPTVRPYLERAVRDVEDQILREAGL